ncbi:RICIN domain-containing protein [Kitasatospora sp. NPDC052896]|uniref:RICIN domain-containing protein n=1 Tax=Kitasatospora sp. NPDC052896 TaxID=3364061 RepID=UPI0037C96F1E
MRRTRLGLGLAFGLGALSWAVAPAGTAQALPVPHSAGQLLPAAGPAAGARVVDLPSLAQLPTGGRRLVQKPATPASPETTYHTTAFTNNDGNECLDGDTNTIPHGNGAKVQLWACNGWSNQNWYWTPVAGMPVGYYTIQNGDGGMCLDGDTNTIPNNGAKVQLWGCNGWNNQRWYWNGSNLQNADGGECLDGDTNTIPNNGAKVQLWACNGWNNQKWTWH